MVGLTNPWWSSLSCLDLTPVLVEDTDCSLLIFVVVFLIVSVA